MATIEDIKARSLQIKNETTEEANTLSRVGGVLVDLTDDVSKRAYISQTVGTSTTVAPSEKAVGDAMAKINEKVDSVDVGDIILTPTDELDHTTLIQQNIEEAYRQQRSLRLTPGIYYVSRAIYLYDGVRILGSGAANTLIRTHFTALPKNLKEGSPEHAKAVIAQSYVERDKGAVYNTATNPADVPKLDLVNGHNRFYLGDGAIGYYDDNRELDPAHPLYYPKPVSGSALTVWNTWFNERKKIKDTGRWIGLTGRENYAKGLLKSTQYPNLKHTTDKNSPDYVPERVGSTMHTGIRNVVLQDFTINTNSIDRGKDTAINFNYDPKLLKGELKEKLDSSVLNVKLQNLVLSDCGGSGYEVYRAVQNNIFGVTARRCAVFGFNIKGVTSTLISDCYANSCIEGGYVLSGMNYSTLNTCAADSCSTAYHISNSNGLSLVSCGAEACKQVFNLDGPSSELLYKGKSYVITDSKDINIISCYSSTSRNNVTSSEEIEISLDNMQDEDWNMSRHIFIDNSINVTINNPSLKSYARIRTTPLKKQNGDVCNVDGGIYDPSVTGSRVWQFQNFLSGAQYEIRGEKTRINIISSQTEAELAKNSEIRTNNLDILDLGIIPNPDGHNTAGKTISGKDGNGGWSLQNGTNINITSFEFLYPLNYKKGKFDKYWKWRNSLVLIRIEDDISLQVEFPTRYKGYKSVINKPVIDWSIDFIQSAACVFDVVKDRNQTKFIDGGSALFSYGTFMFESDKAYKVPVTNYVSAYSKSYPFGTRVKYNYDGYIALDTLSNSAANLFVGNVQRLNENSELKNDPVMVLKSKEKRDDLSDTDKLLSIVDSVGYNILSVYGNKEEGTTKNDKILGFGENDSKTVKMLSRNSAVRAAIALLATDGTVTNTQIVNRINSIIKCLQGHGLIK